MSNETNNNEYLLKVDHLKQYFPVHDGFKKMELKAVDDVSFAIKPGETLGLVGESGCGKTTVGRTLLRLYQPTAGRIEFDGNVLFDSEKKIDVNMHPYRKQMQMVFQDPYSSLNPRMTVEDIIGEPLDVHKLYNSKKERHEMIMDLMETVGLNADHATRYAHEFSGGQRQRIGIARALAVDPKFIVCDEPVSALDVSIQAQVVNMFEDLQKERGLSYLFIAHDLLVVQHISDRIAVMYLGHMMELADADELMDNPIHPYTQSLLSAVPIPDPETARHSKRIVLEGDEKTGAKVILKALEAPLYYIAANAGLEGSVIINKVKESEVGIGFDAYKEEYVDMVKAGILDPAKVTRSALQNATSVASTLLTTESVVSIIPEEAPAAPAGNPGMGMM